MGRKWDELTIGEVCELGDGAHAKVQRLDFGVPYLTSKNIGDGSLKLDSLDHISNADYERLFPAKSSAVTRLKPGDILTGIIGTFGNLYLYKDTDHFGISSAIAILRPDQTRLWPRYLYYYLTSSYFRQKHASYAAGSVQGYTNLPTIRQLPAIVPPLAEQKAIAGVLGALDDKIELNRRMNATLESMARALFQSWFVDFDPVRAKLDGRQPVGMDEETAGLFPECLEDGAGILVPRGWRVGSIYEIANVIYGAPFASSLFNSNRIGKPLIRIRDLPSQNPAVFTTEIHPKGYLLQPGDIAVGMDGEFRAYLWAGEQSWMNQRVCVFVPKSGHSAAYIRNSIIEPLAEVEATETATTVIHLGKNDIDKFTVIIPDGPVTEAFTRECQPWYDQIVANKKQSRTIATLRDTLLPKLLSGELSVAEASRNADITG